MEGHVVGGRYRLLESRAIGGMAAVWRAVDERTGRTVAVKLLHPHLTADDAARERLRREAGAMAAVRSPNVVAVRDVVVDGETPAIVMDWVEGRSLAERLTDDGRLSEGEALRIAAGVASGLAAAHETGIVHRDVKPGNILLDGAGAARLTDFGIATDESIEATALTAEDGVVGTLRYMAPERLLGEPAVPATDVWGLGAVLYEMLAGAAPYAADSVMERAEAARTLPVRPAGVSEGTWAVILRALAGDPGERYADGAAMTDALEQLPADVAADPGAVTEVIPTVAVPTVASSESPVGVGGSGVRAKPGLPALAAAALGVVILVVAAASSSPETPRGDPGVVAATASPRPAESPPADGEEVQEPAPDGPKAKDKDDRSKGKGNGKGKGKGKDKD